jgi:DNA-directed RNA polymerase subunit L/DNA-directed RNA polymerase alpha subunit
MEFANYQNKRGRFATFTLAPIHVAYANTLRRLIMTGVETVAFRADMKDGTTTDVKIEMNDTPMTHQMLAHRIGLLPIHYDGPLNQEELNSLTFSIDVKADKDTFRDVTCKDFIIKRERGEGLEPVILPYDTFFPEDPITRETCLIATLAPGDGRIKLTAKASIGTGRENARFQPTSQCSYTYTRDEDEERVTTHFRNWLRKVKNLSFADLEKKEEADAELEKAAGSAEKLGAYRREYESMEIAKVYLRDAKGEPFSYDFTIESDGRLKIPYMVRRACDVGEAMMGKYTTVESGVLPDKLRVIPSQSRVIGFDFVMKEQDHTFGNMVQTYLEQNHIYDGEEKKDGPVQISYAGYEVPHPLRDEMVLRIGTISKEAALKAFAQACSGCVRIFQQIREAWASAVPEAAVGIAKNALVKEVKTQIDTKEAFTAAATKAFEETKEEAETKKVSAPKSGLRRKTTAATTATK